MVTKRRRAARHKANEALNKGVEIDPETGEPVLVEEPDTEFDIPYTD